ncbi:MAG: hypothetical protein PHG03_03265 [Bacilli bacterium]|nr:hypothetical protein [Bacilli bacterium]MDD4795561.1 hypothetical protein [Bacilli bacterium]
MKISEIFKLNMSQNELNFVDINIHKDIPLFVDPYRISKLTGPFIDDANDIINSFFSYLITLISNGDYDEAEKIFINLNEVNETCFGYSTGKPKGVGLGVKSASDVFKAIKNSAAAKKGVLNSIEDIRVFVKGVGMDRISDMTTNIIKELLIEYTQEQCELYNIPLTKEISSGYFWNPISRRWEQKYTEMLVIDGKKYILIPKLIVTYGDKFTSNDYFQHFVLNFLQNENIKNNTSLVQTKKGKTNDGEKFVTKKDIREKQLGNVENGFNPDKDWLANFTKAHSTVFLKFKNESFLKMKEIDFKEDRKEIAEYLISRLNNIESGIKTADEYNTLVLCILEFIFYPNMSNPKKEIPINDGRKRIDILYNNTAQSGFFFDLIEKYSIPANFIIVESKNYSTDISNPELDQLIGRFSNHRGRFGLSISRKADNHDILLKRCGDILKDDNGLIIPLLDSDIIKILTDIKEGIENTGLSLLLEKYTKIAIQ